MKKIYLLILFSLYLFGAEKLYFLPDDGKKAEKEIVKLITHSHQNIKIAIYTFTNKKMLNAIKKVARRGVKVQIIADYESNKNQLHYSIVPILKKLRNIKVKLLRGKGGGNYKGIMHIKMLIIDDRVVVFGSANYTYSAFYKNFEILYINDDWTFTRKFVKLFHKLWYK